MDKNVIQNLIKELIEKTTIPVESVTIVEDNYKNTWFKVEVKEPHLFINREGEALFALNHLIQKIIENKWPTAESSANPGILIDINDFQKKRIDNIRAIAHMMAERARYFKSNIEIDPMSAFERRVVHEFLSEAVDLKTESVGFGPARRVVIKYIGAI